MQASARPVACTRSFVQPSRRALMATFDTTASRVAQILREVISCLQSLAVLRRIRSQGARHRGSRGATHRLISPGMPCTTVPGSGHHRHRGRKGGRMARAPAPCPQPAPARPEAHGSAHSTCLAQIGTSHVQERPPARCDRGPPVKQDPRKTPRRPDRPEPCRGRKPAPRPIGLAPRPVNADEENWGSAPEGQTAAVLSWERARTRKV